MQMRAMLLLLTGMVASGCAGGGMGVPSNMVDASQEPECAAMDTAFHMITQYVFVTEADKLACQRAVERVAQQSQTNVRKQEMQQMQQLNPGMTPEQHQMIQHMQEQMGGPQRVQ